MRGATEMARAERPHDSSIWPPGSSSGSTAWAKRSTDRAD